MFRTDFNSSCACPEALEKPKGLDSFLPCEWKASMEEAFPLPTFLVSSWVKDSSSWMDHASNRWYF